MEAGGSGLGGGEGGAGGEGAGDGGGGEGAGCFEGEEGGGGVGFVAFFQRGLFGAEGGGVHVWW